MNTKFDGSSNVAMRILVGKNSPKNKRTVLILLVQLLSFAIHSLAIMITHHPKCLTPFTPKNLEFTGESQQKPIQSVSLGSTPPSQ